MFGLFNSPINLSQLSGGLNGVTGGGGGGVDNILGRIQSMLSTRTYRDRMGGGPIAQPGGGSMFDRHMDPTPAAQYPNHYQTSAAMQMPSLFAPNALMPQNQLYKIGG
jgi:hypothetical protein